MTQNLDKIKSNIIKSAELISESKKIVLMTGAGISVDSGIPTFQGTEGLWARFGKPKMNLENLIFLGLNAITVFSSQVIIRVIILNLYYNS